ncbi:hypothetical protein [Streptomyces sp. NPDC001914]|uniref:hypothetical protein n=1 Tax=Streptomyces sp. NPDC001914 TaxID=3364623 RepID=UPI003673EC40
MSQTPVPIPAPIPSRSVPAGTPVWSAGEAARWLRLRHARWAHPLWSVLALLVTVVWAIAVAPEPPCTDAAPCSADWPGMVEMGLAVGLLYWLARLPELTLVAAPALAVVVARLELPDAAPDSLAANLCVLAALGFGWAGALERLAARRRQRGLVAEATGVRHPVPDRGAPLRRGMIPIAAGVVLVAVAAFFVAQGLAGVRDDERHADRADRTVAKVVGHHDESVRVRTHDGRRLTLDSLAPEDHRTGSVVTVLEDGSWRRLASEPYDAMGPQFVVLAAGLPGLSLLVTGLLARRRAAALRRGPVPVLRVLERMDDDGVVWIYAGDDPAGRRPVLGASFVADAPGTAEHGPADPEDAEHGPEHPKGAEHGSVHLTDGEYASAFADDAADDADGDRDRDGDGDRDGEQGEGREYGLKEWFRVAGRPGEAVLFGSPHDGGELLLVTTPRDGEPAVLRTSGPVRMLRPGDEPVCAPQPEADIATGGVRGAATTVPATLITTGRPLSWGPNALARVGGAVVTLIVVANVAFNARDLVTDGIGVKEVLFTLVLLSWLGLAAELLNWRVTADSSGVWLTGWRKVRHVPWDRLGPVRYMKDGSVETRLPDGTGWRLSGLGVSKLERRLGFNPSCARMAEEVNALRHHPELRPTEPASRRARGLPLGPALFVLTVAVALTWAFH